MRTRTRPGRYYERRDDGRLEETVAQAPDVVICRRVADFPGGLAPDGAAVSRCRTCHAAIAFNPAGPHPGRPRICLQCGGIEPEPVV